MDSGSDQGFIPSLFGLPSGVGYERSCCMEEDDLLHVHDLTGADRLIRLLVLKPLPANKNGALLFSDVEMARLLKHL